MVINFPSALVSCFISFDRASPDIWIGLRGHREGYWKWSDESDLGDWTTYQTYPWHPDDPDGSDTINCVRLIKSSGNFVWADRPCSNNFKYLCSRPHENGFIRTESITLLNDNNEWEFLVNRDNT